MADKVAGLLFRISADTKALQTGLKKAQTATSKMKASMKALCVHPSSEARPDVVALIAPKGVM